MYIIAIGPGFYQSLRKNRKPTSDTLSDIHDGKIYQALCSENDCALAKDTNISLTLNTDGVQVYQSTNCSMWPVLLMNNELPFAMR